MDVGTGLTVLGSAAGGARLIEKLLGPTADYLGTGIRDWAQRRIDNTAKVLTKAANLLGPQLDIPGAVPPAALPTEPFAIPNCV